MTTNGMQEAGIFWLGDPVSSWGSLILHSGEWRNRQTRWIQVPVSERMCGFKSRLAHRTLSPRAGFYPDQDLPSRMIPAITLMLRTAADASPR